jgi:peroxiredoxin
MLNLVFSSVKNDQIKSTEFLNSGFNPGNPAYTDLAEQMFSGYFNKLSAGPLKASFDRAIAIASYSELRSVILEDGVITNKELADYVLLISLYSDYFERNLPGDNVRKIISLMKSQGETLFIKDVASILLGKINSTLHGNLFAGFSLLNSDGKLISLPDFRGKYLLLGFARSDSPVSQSELGIINMWYKKYIKDLQVVTILTDKQFKTASELMIKRGFNWICLDGSDKDNIEFKYDLKMYPTFILLDREGKIIASPSSYPSEDLEFVINKIIQAEQAGSATENR